jgi:hypothetical protein
MLLANFLPKENTIFSIGVIDDSLRGANVNHIGGNQCPTSFCNTFSGVFIIIAQVNVKELLELDANALVPKMSPQELINMLESGRSVEILPNIAINFMSLPFDLRFHLIQYLSSTDLPVSWEVENFTFSLRLLAGFYKSAPGSEIA